MNSKPRVAFVVPFLGNWPKWSILFFQSVEANPIVDVILLCETKPSCWLPPNVVLVLSSRDELVNRFNAATGLNLHAISGHKLCDFRPFFGLAFADLLKDYEFWGFCDVDMMFGDLTKLIHSGFLQRMDVFSAHNVQIVGHFTILRNVDMVNHAGFRIENWQAVCENPINKALDELPFTRALSLNPAIRLEKPGPLPVELRGNFCRFGITFGFSGEVAYAASRMPVSVEWRNGKVLYSDAEGLVAEVLYVHFMGLKRWWHWLLSDSGIGLQKTHRFSRIGYGGPTDAMSLVRAPWSLVYGIQKMFLQSKTCVGATSRKLLPTQAFLWLRRLLFGKGRH